jgi:putative glutamine amidotransferase
MKPLIGIIANTDLNRFNLPTTMVPQAYTDSIEKAGGVPLVFPLTRDTALLPAMADAVQGFLFPGGIDIDPSFYNEAPRPELGQVDKTLDAFQFAAADLAIARKKPILAICRGTQLVNVALGGTLFQDISAQSDTPTLKHMQDVISFDTDHDVVFEKGSRLHGLFGPQIPINSRHHQSIKTPGKGLVITARARDGVVEAAQHTSLPIDLVQWHPELMMQKNNDMLPLFRYFVETCQKKH